LHASAIREGWLVYWDIEDEGVAVATLDRPERRNALDIDTVLDLSDRLVVGEQPAVPLVLTGTGKTFCSGFDLSTWEQGAAFKEHSERLFGLLLAYPAPVIAALNGPAVGMGCVLAAMCDLRIGTGGSWLEIPAARLGVVLDEGYIAAIRDRLGIATAQLLFVASRRIDASAALALGALHALADDPIAEAKSWARHSASLDARSLAAHKVFVNGRVMPGAP
jgi:enoyl-CoA hydratase